MNYALLRRDYKANLTLNGMGRYWSNWEIKEFYDNEAEARNAYFSHRDKMPPSDVIRTEYKVVIFNNVEFPTS
jgi:hypothetical protein